MIRKDTRLTILEKGGRIVHKKGFNHTGIKEILDAAGVPKGSFYHYFKNKEDFGLNLLDYYSGFFVQKGESLLDDTDVPPLQRLKRFFDEFLVFFERNNCELGCPIGNLSQEMGDLSPVFAKRLEEIFQMIIDPVEKILVEAIRTGELSDSTDTRGTAEFIINSWEGAILRMKVRKNAEPLRIFDKMIFGGILN